MIRTRLLPLQGHQTCRWRVLLWLCIVGIAMPAWANEGKGPGSEPYQRFEAIAGEAQDSVRFFRVHYWQPLDEHALVLWLGREEPYLVTLRERCNGLMKQMTLRIADYQRPGRNTLRAPWSQIITDDGNNCRIESIRALDLERIDDIDPRYLPRSSASAKRKPLNEIADSVQQTAASDAPGNDGRRWVNLLSIKMPQPNYPLSAFRRGRGGIAQVAAEVAPDGSVLSTELLTSSGTESLDNAALHAVKRWRFEPYHNENPTEHAWVRVPIVFALH